MNYLSFKVFLNLFRIGICLFLLGCSTSPVTEIKYLSGYWEIDFIRQKGEEFKPKASAPLYDHYQMKYPEGILNKVAPRVDGSFTSSEDAVPFQIEKLDKNYYIRFKSRWDEWSRKIIFLDSQKLILENNDRVFYYKRPLLVKF